MSGTPRFPDSARNSQPSEQLRAIQAEKAELAQRTLPAAYHALGRYLHVSKNFLRAKFLTQFDEVDEVRRLRAALKSAIPPKQAWKSEEEKAAFEAQAAALKKRLSRAYVELGRAVLDAEGMECGPESLVNPISDGQSKLAKLNEEISRLESSPNQGKQSLRPLVYLVATAAILSILCFAGLMIYQGWWSAKQGRRDTAAVSGNSATKMGEEKSGEPVSTDSSSPQDSEPAERETAANPAPPVAAGEAGAPLSTENQQAPPSGSDAEVSDSPEIPPVKAVEYKLPPELENPKARPDSPLHQIANKINQEAKQSGGLDGAYPIFSSKGNLLLATVRNSGKEPEFQIWNAMTGERYLPDSPECDYFSAPLVWSPDESKIACLDGDFLRIWDLKEASAKLVQSLDISQSLVKLAQSSGVTLDQEHVNNLISLKWYENDWFAIGLTSSYQMFRFKSEQLEEVGKPDSTPVDTINGVRIYEQIAGRRLAIVGGRPVTATAATSGKSFGIRIINCESGELIKSIVINKAIPLPLLNNGCIEFSKNGKFLLVTYRADPAVEKTDQVKMLLIKTDTWDQSTFLDCRGLLDGFRWLDGKLRDGVNEGSPTEDSKNSWRNSFRLVGFSPDESTLVGLASKKSRTSKGETMNSTLIAFDLKNGERLAPIELGPDFRLQGYSVGDEFPEVEFSSDGKFAKVSLQRGGAREIWWSLGLWEIGSGAKRFSVSKLGGNENPARGSFGWSADGEQVVLFNRSEVSQRLPGELYVFDLNQVSEMRARLDEADKLWSLGKRQEANELYCTLLADDTTSLFDAELQMVYSRCVDDFATRGEAALAKGLVLRARDEKIYVKPESPAGARLLEEFASEQRELADRELNARRKQNQKLQVPANSLSKKQFIEKIKATMDEGSYFDESIVSARFSNYKFWDVFGDPGTNTEFAGYRLISYQCSDGMIQLKVVVTGTELVLVGVDEY